MGIGIWQVVLILAIVLILFGAGKLPRVAGDLAKGIKNFKQGLTEDSSSSEAEAADAASTKNEASATPDEKDKATQG